MRVTGVVHGESLYNQHVKHCWCPLIVISRHVRLAVSIVITASGSHWAVCVYLDRRLVNLCTRHSTAEVIAGHFNCIIALSLSLSLSPLTRSPQWVRAAHLPRVPPDNIYATENNKAQASIGAEGNNIGNSLIYWEIIGTSQLKDCDWPDVSTRKCLQTSRQTLLVSTTRVRSYRLLMTY